MLARVAVAQHCFRSLPGVEELELAGFGSPAMDANLEIAAGEFDSLH